MDQENIRLWIVSSILYDLPARFNGFIIVLPQENLEVNFQMTLTKENTDCTTSSKILTPISLHKPN